MIDSNTYNEIMRMTGHPVKDAPYTKEDVENGPEKRQVDNSEAEAELSTEERERRYKEGIAYITSPEAKEFYRILRRHECNVFNALFKDKETITEEVVKIRVRRAADFFNLPMPILIDDCEVLAKISYTDYTELGSEIRYDISKLKEIGINNEDAFEAMLTHELSHQFLSKISFNFCRNRMWCYELACDFIVGVRCSSGMIASGKYKYAVSQMKTSTTHPDGKFRLKAVKEGFDFAELLLRKGIKVNAQSALIGINRFLCANSKELNESFYLFLQTPESQPQKEKDIMDYPDNNLIKQYVLKFRAEQERELRNGSE